MKKEKNVHKSVHAAVKKKHVRCSQFPIMTWNCLMNKKESIVPSIYLPIQNREIVNEELLRIYKNVFYNNLSLKSIRVLQNFGKL